MLKDIIELTKPRIYLLALIMTSLGYFLSGGSALSTAYYLYTLSGIALLGVACATLNHYLEMDTDRLMKRTANRPLPSGRLDPAVALVMGLVSLSLGLLVLYLKVNEATAILGLLTCFSYLLIYSPLKQISTVSTLVGAIPGALPPLMGSVAASGSFRIEGWLLFLLLFVWQIPHFLAIAWLYKDDYAGAGFPILTVRDDASTTRQILLYTLILFPISLLPSFVGVAGSAYLWGAIILSTWFLWYGIKLAWKPQRTTARSLFFVSIIYLPLIGILMVWNRSI